MIGHGDEQVEEPVSNVIIIAQSQPMLSCMCSIDSTPTHSKPPASISICMVPLLLNVPLLRMINAR